MKKVLIGCAIAFGVVALSGIIGGVVLVNKFKGAMPNMEQASAMEKRLVLRDGAVDDSVMPLDGSIEPYLVQKYLSFAREMDRRNEPDIEQLQRFVDGLSEEKEGAFGGLRKVGSILRGGLGLARITYRVSVTADSLLWEGDFSRAELIYLTGLIRHGAMEWNPPLADEHVDDNFARDRQEEVDEAIESLHEQFERNFRRLLRNQKRALAAKADRSEAEDAWFARLETVLVDRSTFANIEGQLLESQLEVLSPHLGEFARLAATSQCGYYLEIIPMVDDEDDGGVQITIGD